MQYIGHYHVCSGIELASLLIDQRPFLVICFLAFHYFLKKMNDDHVQSMLIIIIIMPVDDWEIFTKRVKVRLLKV